MVRHVLAISQSTSCYRAHDDLGVPRAGYTAASVARLLFQHRHPTRATAYEFIASRERNSIHDLSYHSDWFGVQ